ncbi:isoprenylcysteine carboxylmethyltransferase family protein [Roseibium sp. FZY0029]|uniref:methyltransferase family protein n=1 Tax=Roseibium sp. FZY0029 TaxID=3116647 RepID=UPI002EB3B793|nr:isoprenylcysteine carboxylmethyltransferase family protein [Roseibium sp. FZY0029]
MRLLLPPPVVVGFGFLLLYAGAKLFPALNVTFEGQDALALLFLIAGLAIGGHALFRFVLARTTFNPTTPDKAKVLVTDGFYRVSRNPMYVADVLLLLAFSTYLGTATVFVVVPAFIWYLTEFQIKPEEDHLTRLFGQAYLDYCARVRRWL